MKAHPFWQHKSLQEMTPSEWESLCDRCGRCCLHKLEDADSGDVYYTSVACKLLDTHSCQCTDYPHRKQEVPGCTLLTINDLEHFHWLPATCAYRLVSEDKPLPPWHPLVSNSPETIHQAGVSVRGLACSEQDINEDELEDFIIPLREVNA